MNIKTLLIRSLSGLVYVSLIVSAIIIGGAYFMVVFGLLVGLTLFEFHRLTGKQGSVDALQILSAIFGVILFIVASRISMFSPFFLLVFLLGFVVCCIVELFRNTPARTDNIAYFLLGQVYITMPICLMYEILSYNYIVLLALFVIIWASDTFAYLAGSLFGKHKLSPSISPNKSWEGVVGGLIGALLTALVFYLTVSDPTACEISVSFIRWLIFAVVIVVFGTLGDLLESLLKRTVGVKDSGHIMPGHGGLLDRLDSVIFAVIPAAVYIFIMSIIC
jgi:cytidylyltransferase family